MPTCADGFLVRGGEVYFGTTRCFDTLGREGSGRVSIFIARHCAPDTSARPFASLARGCGQTVGELSAGGEGQQRGAAARSAGADRGGAAAAAASRASLRACPCLDDVERDQKIHLLPASTPTSPWHHNRCQHFSNFLPYALGISSCIRICTALLRGRFSPCFEALCADVGLSPARHSVQMVFLSHAWDRARSTDTLLSTQRAWVSTFTCTLMIASCAVTEMQ